MKLAMNISSSKDSHECIHHSRISPVITTVVMSLIVFIIMPYL